MASKPNLAGSADAASEITQGHDRKNVEVLAWRDGWGRAPRVKSCGTRIALVFFALVSRVAGADLIFEGGFESDVDGVERLGTSDREKALSRTRVVSSPARSGNGGLEVNLDRSSGAHRTDFYLTNIGGRFKVGREYWHGFSVYFPEDWQPDTQNELFAQWVRTTRKTGGPQLAFYINGENLVIRKRWDPRPDDGRQEIKYANLNDEIRIGDARANLEAVSPRSPDRKR